MCGVRCRGATAWPGAGDPRSFGDVWTPWRPVSSIRAQVNIVDSKAPWNRAAGLESGRPIRSDCMQVIISGRHTDLSESLKVHAKEKAEKLDHFYDRLQSVNVVFDEEAGHSVVEVIARADHNETFVAKHSDHDAYATVDHAIKEIETQLRRHKEKHRNRMHLGGKEE